MEIMIRSLILSLMLGISCRIFFETILPKRWSQKWVEYMLDPAFTAGFMLIAIMEIPPYVLQPVRLVAVIAVIAQLFFKVKAGKNLILSITYSSIFWIISMLVVSVASMFPFFTWENEGRLMEPMACGLQLLLTIVFRYKYKERMQGVEGLKLGKFVFLPLCSITVIMAISMLPWGGTAGENNARLAAALGLTVINLCIFYFAGSMLKKEEEMRRLRQVQERMQGQMELYRSMQKNFDWQRRCLHDYKNQLNCIQGMIAGGESEEALKYIAGLTGSLKKNFDCVDTNHSVVNVVLNQKLQDASERGITMTMAVNDLSGLSMGEEDIVTLLVNLIDNAVEACEKLEQNKIIQFKMMLEESQLILSVRNPVKGQVKIKGKRAVSTKQDGSLHGIGLWNVDCVVRKYAGTSVLKCEDGWFYFSAVIPV